MTRFLYFIPFLLLCSILSCSGSKSNSNVHDVDVNSFIAVVQEDIVDSIDVDEIIESEIKESETFFYTQRIDSIEFVRLKNKFDVQQPAYITMTDFDSVSKMLGQIVIFDEETQSPDRFNFRNGTSLKSPYQGEDMFVAYYPDFDILQLEGGHSMDIAYNLATGDTIENIGLPPYMKFSPTKEYLMNGYYTGQSQAFFIQHKQGGVYKTLGYIDWRYDYIRDYFWVSDSTLCLDVPDLDRYLLLTIKGDH